MRILKSILERIGYFITGIAAFLYGLVFFLYDPKFSSIFKSKWYRNPFLCLLIAIGCFGITFSRNKTTDAKKEEAPVEKKSENRTV